MITVFPGEKEEEGISEVENRRKKEGGEDGKGEAAARETQRRKGTLQRNKTSQGSCSSKNTEMKEGRTQFIAFPVHPVFKKTTKRTTVTKTSIPSRWSRAVRPLHTSAKKGREKSEKGGSIPGRKKSKERASGERLLLILYLSALLCPPSIFSQEYILTYCTCFGRNSVAIVVLQ